MSELKLNQLDWTVHTKKDSRQVSIINMYREVFNKDSIPEDKQYWTLGGDCVRDGKLLKNTELHQILDNKLITIDQFHSAENNKKIHDSNKSLGSGNWYHKDLVMAIRSQVAKDNFNPAIINFDSINFMDNMSDLPKNLELLFYYIKEKKIDDVLFVFNGVVHAYKKKLDKKKLHKYLFDNKRFVSKYIMNDSWTLYPETFLYRGEKSFATMGITILYKKA